jgi:hypothetical protein
MPDLTEPQWPTDTDMNRVWESTQTAITCRARGAHRRKVSLIAGAGIVALGITAGAFIIPATQKQLDSTLRCYSDQSTTSEYTDMALADGEPTLDSARAVEGCGASWAYGYMVLGKRVVPDGNQGPITTAPPLGACLQPNDVLAVFPLTGTAGITLTPEELCHTLSLRAPEK